MRHNVAVESLAANIVGCTQAWDRTNFSAKWAREVGLDTRGMRFARDVRRQLEAATGPVRAKGLGFRVSLCTWPHAAGATLQPMLRSPLL